ncbi:hypothetical protein [Cystobacter ferrugineus]|uniref:hypothetical protein n=1 Tax=Cystobacter ferrugineus TaxID=83449 RepID=UPI001FEC7ACC|nr:hypothetical protein [Cystobacter ferrugineus]
MSQTTSAWWLNAREPPLHHMGLLETVQAEDEVGFPPVETQETGIGTEFHHHARTAAHGGLRQPGGPLRCYQRALSRDGEKYLEIIPLKTPNVLRVILFHAPTCGANS